VFLAARSYVCCDQLLKLFVALSWAESFGTLLKNYSATSYATPMKFPTVEQIIQTLPVNSSEHASDTATPCTNVGIYRKIYIGGNGAFIVFYNYDVTSCN